MLKTIKVYGSLRKFLGGQKVFKAEIATASEAISFFRINRKGFNDHIKDKFYKIIVGDYEIDENELNDPVGKQEIKIIPLVYGTGLFDFIGDIFSSSIGKIIGGAALIVAPYLAPALFPTIAIGAGISTASIAIGIGASLAIGGVSQMLTDAPDMPEITPLNDNDPTSNFSFSGIQNVSRSGVAIPLIYGEVFCGSIVGSLDIDTYQIKGDAT